MAGLGLDAYRFSVEWARVEPAEGEFSAEALAHYRAIVDYCVAAGIAPVVTYNHFTAPHWFAKRGGWLDPQAPALFGRYCGVVAEHLGDGPAWAVTLNEPNLPRLLSWFDIPAAARDLERATLARRERGGRGAALPGRQPGAPGGDGRHRRRHGGRAPGGAGGHQGPAARAAGGPQPGHRRRPGGGRRRVGPGPQARRGLRHVAGPGAGRRLLGGAELRARPVRRPRAGASAARGRAEPAGLVGHLPAVAGRGGPLRARGGRGPGAGDRARARAPRRRLAGGAHRSGPGRAARRRRGRRAGARLPALVAARQLRVDLRLRRAGSGCTRWTGRRSRARPSPARPSTRRSRAATEGRYEPQR